jgi:hypothetical protein
LGNGIKPISYFGEYEWEKYNVLFLQKSFPYSDMENPCFSFYSLCLINEDKSLFDIVAHELIYSMSEKLLTIENGVIFGLMKKLHSFFKENK